MTPWKIDESFPLSLAADVDTYELPFCLRPTDARIRSNESSALACVVLHPARATTWRFSPGVTALPSVLMHARMPSDPLQSQQARKLISAHVRSPDNAVMPASQSGASSTQPATIMDKNLKKQGASRWRSSKLYLACLRAPVATRSARCTDLPDSRKLRKHVRA